MIPLANDTDVIPDQARFVTSLSCRLGERAPTVFGISGAAFVTQHPEVDVLRTYRLPDWIMVAVSGFGSGRLCRRGGADARRGHKAAVAAIQPLGGLEP